jgi:hypothetical protein
MDSSACCSSAVEWILMGFVTWMYAMGFTEPALFVFISISYDCINDLQAIVHMQFKSNFVDFPGSSSLYNYDLT